MSFKPIRMHRQFLPYELSQNDRFKILHYELKLQGKETLKSYLRQLTGRGDSYKIDSGAPRPEGPTSGAPYSYGKEKETHR